MEELKVSFIQERERTDDRSPIPMTEKVPMGQVIQTGGDQASGSWRAVSVRLPQGLRAVDEVERARRFRGTAAKMSFADGRSRLRERRFDLSCGTPRGTGFGLISSASDSLWIYLGSFV
jgi:hypothetical protein